MVIFLFINPMIKGLFKYPTQISLLFYPQINKLIYNTLATMSMTLKVVDTPKLVVSGESGI